MTTSYAPFLTLASPPAPRTTSRKTVVLVPTTAQALALLVYTVSMPKPYVRMLIVMASPYPHNPPIEFSSNAVFELLANLDSRFSYAAFDDQTSTFILPEGGGFGVVFCPPGRSTTILSSLGPQLRDWASRGVTPQLLQQLQNETLIQQQAAGGAPRDKRWGVSWLVGMVGLIGLYNV